MAVVFIAAPLPLLSQEAPRYGDRDPSHVEISDDRDTRGDASSKRPQGEFRDRIADAVETVERACVADIEAFCGG